MFGPCVVLLYLPPTRTSCPVKPIQVHGAQAFYWPSYHTLFLKILQDYGRLQDPSIPNPSRTSRRPRCDPGSPYGCTRGTPGPPFDGYRWPFLCPARSPAKDVGRGWVPPVGRTTRRSNALGAGPRPPAKTWRPCKAESPCQRVASACSQRPSCATSTAPCGP